ncbi:MAG: MarR family winged helix-turn-helix transcriptional regulator [Alphaproteobacteria bacterium]|jgi:DNA-binding MarR family transcriptional regulator|nr:MarR family winged helix-turn-helix transcriptional regulator [Alphaproteobacteria bacterium]
MAHKATSKSAPRLKPEDGRNCTGLNLRKATRAVTQYYDAALQPSGLKSTQFSLLSVVETQGPIVMGGLAEVLVMDRTTLTRNLKPLEAQGLIRIEPGKDRRARIVSLTAKGRKVVMTARPLWRQAQTEIVGRLGETRWRGLLHDLRATIAAVPEV